jgi:hypothetical protein
MSRELINNVWEIPKKYEVMGMENAVLGHGLSKATVIDPSTPQ